MPDQRIDQLNAETTPAAVDLLPVFSIAGADTKKITVKNLIQVGATLIDDASIPVAKVNLGNIGGTNINDGTVTVAKLNTAGIPATGGVTVSGGNLQLVAPTSPIARNASTGSLEHAVSGIAAAGTYTKVTVDTQGHVTAGTTLVDADIPSPTTTAGTFTKLTIDTKGRVTAGATLTDADVPALVDSGVTAGTYTKLTVDAKGRVTVGANLAEADVPLINTGVGAGTYTKVTVDVKGRVTAGTTLTDADVPVLANSGITAGTYTKVTVDVKGRATAGTTLVAADLPVATSATVGGVSIPAAGGLALTGGGALSHSNAVAGGASTRSGITYDLQGHIVSTVAIVASDLPAATTAVKGAVIAGTGLAVDVNGILSTNPATTSDLGGIKIGSEFDLNGSNQLLLATQANVAGGTAYPKVTVNSKGVVTAGAALASTDIPNLDASKITTGSVDIARIGTNTITGAKIANYAVTKIGDTQPTADHIGQFFFNPLSRDLALFDGNVFQPIGISVGEIVFAGTFDASTGSGTGLINSVTVEGIAIGLAIGQALPAPAAGNSRYYLVVAEGGTITTGNAPHVVLAPPDILLSNGITWTEIDVSETITAQTANNISFTPAGSIVSVNVQTAIQELDGDKLALAGGTVTGNLEIGTAGSLSFEGTTTNDFETTLAVVDPTADRTITLPNISGTVLTTGDTGTVTSTMLLDGTILNADINASAAIAYSKLAALTSANILVGSSANVATSTAVTGDVTINNTGVTAIASDVIVNADVNATAAIAGTKVTPNFGAQTVITTGSGLIGTATSLATVHNSSGPLQVASDSVAAIQIYGFNSIGADFTAALELSRARGTQASPTIVASGDYIGEINFAGYNTNFQRGATIYALVDGEPGTAGDVTDMPGKLVFATTPNGSDTPTTRMSIDSAGAVTLAGALRFADADSSHYVALQAPATITSNVTLTLPSADGTSNQVLTTNGSGTLSFSTPAAGVSLGLVIALS